MEDKTQSKILLPNRDSFSKMSVSKICEFLSANAEKFSDVDLKNLEILVNADGRSGVVTAYKKVIKLRSDLKEEIARVKKLYEFEETIAAVPGSTILGLDEVGRGPLAGPLTVGGVILKRYPHILGLNDSKQINESKRKEIASQITEKALICKTFSVPPKYIDDLGMTECLKRAFANVVKQIEDQGIKVDMILLDGNPLHFDRREVNVIKGDAKCASISAASIIAKVERDAYMSKMSESYPNYGFDKNKGYGTAQHIEAIKKYGLTNIHRKSFCSSFMQMSLF